MHQMFQEEYDPFENLPGDPPEDLMPCGHREVWYDGDTGECKHEDCYDFGDEIIITAPYAPVPARAFSFEAPKPAEYRDLTDEHIVVKADVNSHQNGIEHVSMIGGGL
jgi:hypothetical protein